MAKASEYWQRSCRVKLDFILANKLRLLGLKNGPKLAEIAEKFSKELDRSHTLSIKQVSYVDGIYEKIWKAAGMPSVDVKHDPKKKGFELR